MKYCLNCGKKLVDLNAQFCPYCGEKAEDNNWNYKTESVNNTIKGDVVDILNKGTRAVKSFGMGRIILLYVLVTSMIGLFVMGLFTVSQSGTNRKVSKLDIVEVTGKIIKKDDTIAYNEDNQSFDKGYYYTVVYNYDDSTYSYKSDVYHKVMNVGDEIPVYILSDHPEEASLDSPSFLLLIGQVAGAVGMLLIGASFVLLIVVVIVAVTGVSKARKKKIENNLESNTNFRI